MKRYCLSIVTVIAASALLAGCRRDGDASSTGAAPDSFVVALETSRGPITVAIHRDWAPIGVDRFYHLLQQRFYDEARFFRVVPGFVAQFGMPADPQMAARYVSTPIPDDPVRHSNLRGTLVYAHAGPGSRSSQLFINLRDNPALDTRSPGFAPIGEIVAGITVIDSLNGEYNAQGGGPSQDSIGIAGNAYLNRAFPRLDYIRTARVVREWRGAQPD